MRKRGFTRIFYADFFDFLQDDQNLVVLDKWQSEYQKYLQGFGNLAGLIIERCKRFDFESGRKLYLKGLVDLIGNVMEMRYPNRF
ncbi:hypothetical protein B4N84_15035 [Flavobacterium sp. IR1]|nr:hypothetical protein B4N84_15035 [Flavobacterium sp. IR1]